MSVPLVQDTDFTLYVGDVREMLACLPDASVDCVVTSPPYWGLRDYGTGEWVGGDPACDHERNGGRNAAAPPIGGQSHVAGAPHRGGRNTGTCDCGAVVVDSQIGLESSPAEYVANLVEVFRAVRRVLAPHGTLWLNLGDSYAANRTYQVHNTKGASEHTYSEGASVPDGLKAKDLVGIPWRVAFALQADGWYLRSDIIWSKPNPMPESVTDRPTKSHEYVFMLSKEPRYFFDQEAVREAFETTHAPGRKVNETYHYGAGNGGNDGLSAQLAAVKARLHDRDQDTLDASLPHEAERGPDGRRVTHVEGREGSAQHRDGERWPNSGRNIRSVWEIATQPYAEAHFATFPVELPRRCIAAGCPERVCRTCGKPRQRIVEKESNPQGISGGEHRETGRSGALGKRDRDPEREARIGATETVGWSDCGHDDWRPGVVLDPFMGAGTTALVARKLGRHAVGVELNPEYAELASARLSQLSLLADA